MRARKFTNKELAIHLQLLLVVSQSTHQREHPRFPPKKLV